MEPPSPPPPPPSPPSHARPPPIPLPRLLLLRRHQPHFVELPPPPLPPPRSGLRRRSGGPPISAVSVAGSSSTETEAPTTTEDSDSSGSWTADYTSSLSSEGGSGSGETDASDPTSDSTAESGTSGGAAQTTSGGGRSTSSTIQSTTGGSSATFISSAGQRTLASDSSVTHTATATSASSPSVAFSSNSFTKSASTTTATATATLAATAAPTGLAPAVYAAIVAAVAIAFIAVGILLWLRARRSRHASSDSPVGDTNPEHPLPRAPSSSASVSSGSHPGLRGSFAAGTPATAAPQATPSTSPAVGPVFPSVWLTTSYAQPTGSSRTAPSAAAAIGASAAQDVATADPPESVRRQRLANSWGSAATSSSSNASGAGGAPSSTGAAIDGHHPADSPQDSLKDAPSPRWATLNRIPGASLPSPTVPLAADLLHGDQLTEPAVAAAAAVVAAAAAAAAAATVATAAPPSQFAPPPAPPLLAPATLPFPAAIPMPLDGMYSPVLLFAPGWMPLMVPPPPRLAASLPTAGGQLPGPDSPSWPGFVLATAPANPGTVAGATVASVLGFPSAATSPFAPAPPPLFDTAPQCTPRASVPPSQDLAPPPTSVPPLSLRAASTRRIHRRVRPTASATPQRASMPPLSAVATAASRLPHALILVNRLSSSSSSSMQSFHSCPTGPGSPPSDIAAGSVAVGRDRAWTPSLASPPSGQTDFATANTDPPTSPSTVIKYLPSRRSVEILSGLDDSPFAGARIRSVPSDATIYPAASAPVRPTAARLAPAALSESSDSFYSLPASP
ncbi:hypothetical protein HK405_003861 [Cladochytrium tenue]|nr:hypothetical protein HK405_003861 [Cladochytrium tenue]